MLKRKNKPMKKSLLKMKKRRKISKRNRLMLAMVIKKRWR